MMDGCQELLDSFFDDGPSGFDDAESAGMQRFIFENRDSLRMLFNVNQLLFACTCNELA